MESKKHYLFNIEPFCNNCGSLIALEEKKEIPFKIKRGFFEYDLKSNAARGNHANKNSRFCIVAIFGSCDITISEGNKETVYHLDSPSEVLYLDKMIWKTMNNFSNNCILLILSDCVYEKNEYIRDYDEYLREYYGKSN